MSRTTLQVEIGAALRAARWARGITQEELSRVLGIDRSTFARYEAGDRTIPATVLLECATHLNLSVDELLGHKRPARDVISASDGADTSDTDVVIAILRQHPALATMVREMLETMRGIPRRGGGATDIGG
ncbi:MAG: helix-turn-helix transcriptional regulator [Chloroflexota bacterium]|nr:helix-turn-helix transcriptional regulator [Chloroflexota bacterium]